MASLSRQLAQWITGLRYEDLPPEVVDRAKGVTLQALASVLLGAQTPAGRSAVKLIVDEELGVNKGASIMVDGRTVYTPLFSGVHLGRPGLRPRPARGT